MANLLFYVMGLGAVACSLGVVSARNPVVSVLSLLGSFICLAVIYLLAGFQFMAAAQLLVYAGAIMVLFLFVVMLLNLGQEAASGGSVDRSVLRARRMPLVFAISAAVLLLTLFGISSADTIAATDPVLVERGVSSMSGLAALLFSTYLLPFEAASMLLLAATIAVIVLAKRQREPVEREPTVRSAAAGGAGIAGAPASEPATPAPEGGAAR